MNENRGAGSRIATLAASAAILSTLVPWVPNAAAEELCVYGPGTVSSCQLTCAANLSCSGAVREANFVVATGDTYGTASTMWAVTACPEIEQVQCGESQEDEPTDIPGAVDFGTYGQGWVIVYKGDAECVKIEGDYWHSQGWMTTKYLSWSWNGHVSSGSGERSGDYPAMLQAVDAEGSNQPECDGVRQVSFEAARLASEVYASGHFGQWSDVGLTSTASWNPGGVATCATGQLVEGLDDIGGAAQHSMTGGTSPLGVGTSGSFSITGTATYKDMVVPYTGEGDIKACLVG